MKSSTPAVGSKRTFLFRRHKSDSESEEEYQERQRKSKKEKVEDKIASKDVRRVAPKESQAAEQSSKSDTNIIPNPSRRISLKTSAKKMDSSYGEEDSKRYVHNFSRLGVFRDSFASVAAICELDQGD